MTPSNSPQPDRNPNSPSRTRAELLQRFKLALRDGESPSVSEYVESIAEGERSVLLRELLEIEADYQRLHETLEVLPGQNVAASNESTRGDEATLHQSSQPGNENRNEESPPPFVGRYEVGRPIGQGGFGSVYLGWDPQLQREVAIKIPRFRETDPEKRQKRIAAFLAEARAAVQLERHAGIIPVYDAGMEDGVCYIVSQYAPGGSLSDSAEQWKMSLAEKMRFTANLADTIAFAHEHGWIHRDIKPSNILTDDAGKAYLTDFGLTLKAADLATSGGLIEGTPKYMAPEQAQAANAAMKGQKCDVTVDHRSDIYSLGVVFYELLTDQLPHSGDSVTDLFEKLIHQPVTPPHEVSASIPASVSRLGMRALEKDPKQRFQSATEFRDQLRAQANAIESAIPMSSIEPQGNSQVISVAVIGGILALLVVGFAAWWVTQSRDQYLAPNESPDSSQVAVLDTQPNKEPVENDLKTGQPEDLKRAAELDEVAVRGDGPLADAVKPPASDPVSDLGFRAQPRNRRPLHAADLPDSARPFNGAQVGGGATTSPFRLGSPAGMTSREGATDGGPFSLNREQPGIEAGKANQEFPYRYGWNASSVQIAAERALLASLLENQQTKPAELRSAVRRLRDIAGNDTESLKLIERAKMILSAEEPPEVE